MANREDQKLNSVHVETNLETRLSIAAPYNELLSDFTQRFRNGHQNCFPHVGEIDIVAFKVQRGSYYYNLDDMPLSKAFKGFHDNEWFMFADVERVKNRQLGAIMPVADGLVLMDGNTIEEGLETEVVDKKMKKRKIESSDGKKRRKKSKIAVADESRELGGNVAMTEVSPSDELAIVKDIVKSEKDGISMGEEKQTIVADLLSKEKSVTRDEVKDEQANEFPKEVVESQEARGEVSSEKLDDLMETMEQDLGEGGKPAGLDKIDQAKELAPVSSRDDVTESHEAGAQVQVAVAPEHCQEKNEMLPSGAIEKNTERGEGSGLPPDSDNLSTADLVTDQKHQLEASSAAATGPATEKRKKKKKSGKDDINQLTATASTSSGKIANEINGVPGNEMGEKIVEGVGRENSATNNLEGNPASQLKVNGGLTTGLVSEKKRKRTKTSKDDIIQSTAAATTISREVVNEREKVSDHVDTTSEKLVNALKETMQNENELGDKVVDNGQVDADEAKSVMKSPKKKKSRKTTSPAEEDTLVDYGTQNVEPFKVVDGEGPDSVIRNVLDSLHQRNETQERFDKIEKKASKKSKKSLSSDMVDSQVLSVEATDNNEDPYLSQQTQKVSIEVEENGEDPYLSQQTQKRENADMGDNSGSRQKDDIVVGGKKQDRVAGGAKSKKEKKSLDMRPAGSIDGSLSSMKLRERNTKGKPASSVEK